LIAPLDAYMRLESKYSLRILEMLLEGRPKGKASGYWEIEVPIDTIRASFKLDDRYKKAKALRILRIAADYGIKVQTINVIQELRRGRVKVNILVKFPVTISIPRFYKNLRELSNIHKIEMEENL
jgi:acetolactate synthase regulatory subunit